MAWYGATSYEEFDVAWLRQQYKYPTGARSRLGKERLIELLETFDTKTPRGTAAPVRV